jgi:hypothetical protein
MANEIVADFLSAHADGLVSATPTTTHAQPMIVDLMKSLPRDR